MQLEHKFKPSEVPIEDRFHILQDRLYRELKHKLYSGRKDDPEIQIEIPVEVDVFKMSVVTICSIARVCAVDGNQLKRKQI